MVKTEQITHFDWYNIINYIICSNQQMRQARCRHRNLAWWCVHLVVLLKTAFWLVKRWSGKFNPWTRQCLSSLHHSMHSMCIIHWIAAISTCFWNACHSKGSCLEESEDLLPCLLNSPAINFSWSTMLQYNNILLYLVYSSWITAVVSMHGGW